MTTTTETTVEIVRSAYREQLAAMPDPADVPNTYNEQARDGAKRSFLTSRLRLLEKESRIVAELDPQIATLTTWRDFLAGADSSLNDALTTLDPQDPTRQGIVLSLQWIHRGLPFETELLPARLPLDDLLRGAGYARETFAGTLPQTETRLRDLIVRRDDAQDRIDRTLAEYDARKDMKETV